jgi:hypothetical protein
MFEFSCLPGLRAAEAVGAWRERTRLPDGNVDRVTTCAGKKIDGHVVADAPGAGHYSEVQFWFSLGGEAARSPLRPHRPQGVRARNPVTC